MLERLFYSEPGKDEVSRLIEQVKRERDLLMTYVEAQDLYMLTKATRKINGDIAEVGVYAGGSARLICEYKGIRGLHLFDTFDGLPKASESDPVGMKEGRLTYRLDNVKEYLVKFPNVHYHPGLFPITSEPVKGKQFSMIHLDADLYESTRDGLQFFYPRMNKGGAFIIHDYSSGFSGVKKAVDEFLKDKPETCFELPGTQCLITKVSQ